MNKQRLDAPPPDCDLLDYFGVGCDMVFLFRGRLSLSWDIAFEQSPKHLDSASIE